MILQPRIFGIGFNKTGTTTLGRCFDLLGLGPTARPQVLHDTYMPGSAAARGVAHLLIPQTCTSPDGATFGEYPYRAICDQQFDHANAPFALALAQGFRCFHDRPWNVGTFYQQLDAHFPGSRFILTWRDPEIWWRSTERWLTVMHRDDPARMERFLKHCRTDRLDREPFLAAYAEHNAGIRAYFAGRPDLLDINFEEEPRWERLCAFLDCPVPEAPFPHENRQNYAGQ